MCDQHSALPAPHMVSSLITRQSFLQTHPLLTLLRHITGKHLSLASALPTLRGTISTAGEGVMIHVPRACRTCGPPAGHVAQQTWTCRQHLWAPSALPKPQTGRQSSPNLRKAGQKSGTLLLPRSARSKGLSPAKRAEQSVVLKWL